MCIDIVYGRNITYLKNVNGAYSLQLGYDHSLPLSQ